MMLRTAFGQIAGRILGGPFAGMRYGGAAHGSPFGPKVFGVYESEILPFIRKFEADGVRAFIDVGSAEGYFSCGWAWRNRERDGRVFSFELEEAAREEQLRNAKRNGLGDRIQLRGACHAAALEEVLAEVRTSGESVWMLCDIEGAEYELLGEEMVQLLRYVPLIVEIHDFVRPNLGELIAARFAATHEVTRVSHQRKTAKDISPGWLRLLAWPLLLRNSLMLDDGRPDGNYWLVLHPKAPEI